MILVPWVQLALRRQAWNESMKRGWPGADCGCFRQTGGSTKVFALNDVWRLQQYDSDERWGRKEILPPYVGQIYGEDTGFVASFRAGRVGSHQNIQCWTFGLHSSWCKPRRFFMETGRRESKGDSLLIRGVPLELDPMSKRKARDTAKSMATCDHCESLIEHGSDIWHRVARGQSPMGWGWANHSTPVSPSVSRRLAAGRFQGAAWDTPASHN